MPRRIHAAILKLGDIRLAPAQAHHLRDVLRLKPSDPVEAFDDSGATAQATVLSSTSQNVTLRVTQITPARPSGFFWTVAAAVPRGPRADWMVEKLAELGTGRFIPLAAARSVSLPAGSEKIARWSRLAAEAARQSGRIGNLSIDPLTPLADLLAARNPQEAAWYFSTRADAQAAWKWMNDPPPPSLLMLIGPEGGWTDEEISLFESARLPAVKLAETTLRVETAAIAAAALAAAWSAGRAARPFSSQDARMKS